MFFSCFCLFLIFFLSERFYKVVAVQKVTGNSKSPIVKASFFQGAAKIKKSVKRRSSAMSTKPLCLKGTPPPK